MTERAPRLLINLVVNGRGRALEVEPHHTLLDVLRDEMALTGAKECCLVGECGACTVIVDGHTVDSCLMLAVEADGTDLTTIEGLGDQGRLDRIQAAFLDHGGVQCGFCIPGQIISAHVLLEAVPHPTLAEVEEAIAGNLCRCGCYEQITTAILSAAEATDR
jgi:aerobic-type carbon monoxide dehydrogenase small subunit (CoxS/CutS family)